MLIPNTTAVPMTPRDAAPEPLASISGTQPRMKANEVIQDWAQAQLRTFERCLDEGLALLTLELGELHNQDRIFRRLADEHHKANLRVDVVVEVARN
jgi:hypothetical protein